MTLPRPVPGAPPVGPQGWQSHNGTCPTCFREVFWVRDHTYGADGSGWHAPLDKYVVEGYEIEEGLIYVAVSSTGAAAAITPQRHRPHRCPREAVDALLVRVGSLGFYTAEVLSVFCTVCGAAPGMLCLDVRRDASPRPHGARRVSAEGGRLD